MTQRHDSAGAPSLAAGRASSRCGLVQPDSGANGKPLGPEPALDGLLAALERSELSATEIRLLLWLAEREATVTQLTAVLGQRPRVITSVAYRLAMRGLIRRRFESGQRSGFVFGITSAGELALRPLLQWVTGTRPADRDNRS
jgi:DNA-binding MarR family transcriptional regulator